MSALHARIGRVRELVHKEFIQVLRDSRMRRMLVIAPILQLVIFGYAVSTDVREVKTFVVDQDQTRVSRELIAALSASGRFAVVGRSLDPSDLTTAILNGSALAGIQIPPGFAADAAAGEGEVQVIVDGTQSNTALIAGGYAERIIASYAAGLREEGGRAAAGIDLRERAWFNPGLVSRNYNVPGVVAVLILLICLLLTSLAVVREREIGTLEQLMVSPLRPSELIAGKTIPFGLIGLLDLGIVLAVALLWFKIPFAGSFPLLLFASLLYLLSALGTGLLISATSRTQQEAFMATFLIFMPIILLSGFMFPVSSMPEIFRWLTLLNPVRHYLEIVRAIFLKGAGLDVLWPQFAALLVLGVGILAAAGRRFRQTLG